MTLPPKLEPFFVKTPVKVTLITSAAVIALVIVALVAVILTRPPCSRPFRLVRHMPGARSDSHVLDDAGADAPTLVEFLVFECEACGAFYPVVEQIRADYAGEINYVVRYFPLPGHFNSMNAALAAEAAAPQGKFEEMYARLFETQAQWGEQQTSHAELFRTFAQDLGLDLDAYDEAIASPATKERVEADLNDGQHLDISGTPTFFLDGKKLELAQLSDLTDALDDAVAR
ncbi:DsbA family protein [Microbacterium esteraromaticum]|uniref:DsbA family protein n=1 Tax=Microbacterium esteraromaticum TaxID=57043 RepID=UPI001D4A8881|nr:protein-disulfide isomerase [Microbacterium esteraromaticum]